MKLKVYHIFVANDAQMSSFNGAVAIANNVEEAIKIVANEIGWRKECLKGVEIAFLQPRVLLTSWEDN